MRAAVELYPSQPRSSQPNMMRDYNIVMNSIDMFDERSIIARLKEDNFKNRIDALEQLRNEIRTSNSLPIKDPIDLFQGIECALSDPSWDLKRLCLLLIAESIPFLRINIDACIGIVLPLIIANLGHTKLVVRKLAVQAVRAYMKHTSDMPSLLHHYVEFGLEHAEAKVRKETTLILPVIITDDFATEDFSELVVSLCKKLVDRDEDEKLQQEALASLKKLCSRTGDSKFRSYLMKLQPQLRDYYCQVANFSFNLDTADSNLSSHYVNSTPQPVSCPPPDLFYGIIPATVMNQLSDENFRNRGQAVEQLKLIVENLQTPAPLMPHITDFLRLLNQLLEDNNFKIITVTLEIMGVLVNKTSVEIQPHLELVIQTLTKRMGDNKNVVRQAITKVVLQLMQTLKPKIVLLLLCNNLTHRSPRVRTEAINCVINALLTFPSYEFDLAALCSSMSYCLLDIKRAVRHAALECIAVLASCLGAGRLQPLMAAVDQIEKKYGKESEGVTAAVHARLTRRTLPRRNEDNLIEYAVQLPNLNSSRNGSLGPQGADVDWILAGAGAGGSSARTMRLEDLESTSRQSSASLDGRRHLSSGKKSKLPWDDAVQTPKGGNSPVRPKQTWTEDKSPDVSRRSSKQGKHRDDILLASVSYNGSPEVSHIETPVVEPDQAKSPFSSKSVKPTKQEGATPRPHKHSQKETVEGSKSYAGKPMLNPLPAREGSPVSSLANTWALDPVPSPAKDFPPASNIPVKAAAIARKSGSNKPAKVPPIPKSHSPVNIIDDDILVDNNGNDLPQLNASLSKIRSSATKKKANKLFEKLEKQQSETEFPANSSSISSPSSNKTDNPFEARPKLARHTSHSTKSKSQPEISEKIAGMQPVSQAKGAELRPTKSDSLALKIRQATSKSLNGTSAGPPEKDEMVAIRGRGYNEDSVETPPKAHPKPKRRVTKANAGTAGSSLSPLGLAAPSAPGMIPITDDDADLVSIIGRGMFDGDSIKAKSERSSSISLKSEQSSSLVKSSSGYGTLRDTSAELAVESDEDIDSLQMSRGLREVAAKKKRERQEESEARRKAQQEREEALRAAEEEQRRVEQVQAAERKRKQQEAAERRRKELEQRRAEERVAEIDRNLLVAGNSPIKTPSLSAHTPSASLGLSPTPSSASNYSSVDELRPFSKPSLALKEALKVIGDDDWSSKADGLNKIRRLAAFHADVLQPTFHAVTLAVLTEVKNLRSQVAKLAVITLGELFVALRKTLDPELDSCAKTLLPKNGEANEFIRAELDRTLGAMASHTTPQRCLVAFIIGGASHKNAVVRKLAIKHMLTLCEKLGPGRLLSGIKDLTDKVLPVLSHLCADSSPETRWYARKILLMLIQHPDFESVLNKHVSTKDFRDVLQIAETLKLKGLGEMPSDTPSAKGTRRGTTFNRGSRTNSAESTDSVASSIKGRRSNGPQAVEDVTALLESMGSANWSTRNDSITELVNMVQTKPRVVSSSSVKIFDKYASLIKDSNSKVALHALEALLDILPQVKHDISPSSINMLVQNTAAGLASKNKELYEKASNLLDGFINNIEYSTLFQPFVQVAMNATARTKPDIVDRVAYLSKKVYRSKPKAVVLHALPLAWNLIRSISTTGAGTTLKGAVKDFTAELFNLMGDSLFDHAASAPGSNPQFVEKVREMSQGGQ